MLTQCDFCPVLMSKRNSTKRGTAGVTMTLLRPNASSSNRAMDRDSHCPYLLSSETTAKGTGLEYTAGKEDPVELDSSPTL
eukprot:PRCOL_00001202-RA